MALGGLLLLIVAMTATVLLAVGVVLARPVAVVVAGLACCWFVLLWTVLPMWHRRRHRSEGD